MIMNVPQTCEDGLRLILSGESVSQSRLNRTSRERSISSALRVCEAHAKNVLRYNVCFDVTFGKTEDLRQDGLCSFSSVRNGSLTDKREPYRMCSSEKKQFVTEGER
jgi:hypothetical protein